MPRFFYKRYIYNNEDAKHKLRYGRNEKTQEHSCQGKRWRKKGKEHSCQSKI